MGIKLRKSKNRKKTGSVKEKRPQRPEICLSLDCADMEEIKRDIEEYKNFCQIVEWCVDKTDGTADFSEDEFISMLREIKKMCRGKKLIVDYKGDAETGNRIQRQAMGYADIIDIDAANPDVSRMIREARRKKTKTIVSYHNFDRMMDRDEIAEQFLRMEKSRADILKIACIAKTEEDTYSMLEGAAAYSRLTNHKPIVAIAMGYEGSTSRVCAGDFGSVISYACGSRQTAPGQFNAKTLSGYLDIYYGEKK